MFPSLFPLLNATPAVTAIFGTSPLRIYPEGAAPQKGAPGYLLPYAVTRLINGLPNQYIGTVPDGDDYSVQVDVYATTAANARNGAKAIRNAVEVPQLGYVTYNGDGQDPDTKNSYYSISIDWLQSRS